MPHAMSDSTFQKFLLLPTSWCNFLKVLMPLSRNEKKVLQHNATYQYVPFFSFIFITAMPLQERRRNFIILMSNVLFLFFPLLIVYFFQQHITQVDCLPFLVHTHVDCLLFLAFEGAPHRWIVVFVAMACCFVLFWLLYFSVSSIAQADCCFCFSCFCCLNVCFYFLVFHCFFAFAGHITQYAAQVDGVFVALASCSLHRLILLLFLSKSQFFLFSLFAAGLLLPACC